MRSLILFRKCRRHAGMLCLGVWVWVCSVAVAAGETGPGSEQLRTDVLRLQEALEEQTLRIDRLYRLLEPHLEEMEAQAEHSRKQAEEDNALGMERIAEISDSDLTRLGCVNPAAAEFVVITREGGARIYDATGKAGTAFRKAGEVFSAVAVSPDGSELLTGTQRGELLVWDMARGTCTGVIADVGRAVDRVAWVGNHHVAWGSHVKYWKEGGHPVNHDQPAGAVIDRGSGDPRWTFRAYILKRRFTLAGSSDGTGLLVHGIPGEVRGAFLLDGATGEIRHTCYDAQHGSGPLSVAMSSEGRVLAVGYAPRDIGLWDAHTGKWQMLLEGHSNWVVSLAFSADGKRLVSGAGDSTARLWEVDTGKEIGRLRFKGSSTYIYSVGLAPEGDIVFALSTRGELVVAKAPAEGS